MKRALLGIGAVFLFCMSTLSAQATPPSIVTFEIDDEFPLLGCEVNGNTFDVWVFSPTKITIKSWFEDGIEVRRFTRLNVRGARFYNFDDPDIFVTQNNGNDGVGENLTARENFVTGEVQVTGAPFRLTIPGIGRVLMDVGVFKVDEDGNVVINGQSFFLADGESAPALCEALAP